MSPLPPTPHTAQMLPECRVYLEALAANYEGQGRALDHVSTTVSELARAVGEIDKGIARIEGHLEGRHEAEAEITGSRALPAAKPRKKRGQLAINITAGHPHPGRYAAQYLPGLPGAPGLRHLRQHDPRKRGGRRLL